MNRIEGDSRNDDHGAPGALELAEAHLRHAESDLVSARQVEQAAEAEIDEVRKELERLKHDEIFLDIATPKGPFRGVFHESTTVATVIEIVADKKHLDKKDTFELIHDGTKLEPTGRTLESFGLRRHACLELVATGSGVYW